MDGSYPVSVSAGLSPLARGTREIVGKNPWLTRFIPAGAGNTRSPFGRTGESPVYPRWRGEHVYYCLVN
ncbi:FIG01045727: hypothetical protein [Salmonella enterica subsp. enterica serovar Stanley]|nr:FIG01045727: hypothetical protein [Salmonella enterica subsp. enterica serovar Stanley]